MIRLYLAGPMRNYPDSNFPEFDAKAEMLRNAGYMVLNPAEHDRWFEKVHYRKPTVRECLAYDVEWICKHADGVALLAGWEESFGARAEVALAQAVGIPHNFVVAWLQQAKRKEAA